MYKHLSRSIIPALLVVIVSSWSASADDVLTKKSPEVVAAIEKGIEYLSKNGAADQRIGALALTGMSLITYGKSVARPMEDHPMVVKCAEKIQTALGDRNPDKLKTNQFDVYSTGLAIIFFVERSPERHRADIKFLLAYLRKTQKSHGGWGYPSLQTGDTSMTQYGVLSSWMARKAGFDVPIESFESVANWLLLTQDPSGAYGYQGRIGEDDKLVKQSNIRPSLSAAGLGSLYICCDILDLNPEVEQRDEDLTGSMKEVKPDAKDQPTKEKVKSSIDPKSAHAAQDRGNQWFAENFKVDVANYNLYYYYAFERYMSVREHCEKKKEANPKWYSDIAAYLLKNQADDGSWKSDCGVVSDTSFAVLFLLRSMEIFLPSLKEYDGGVAIPGQGFPKHPVVTPEGKLVPGESASEIDRILGEIQKPGSDDIDDIAGSIVELPAEKIEDLIKKHGDVLRRMANNKSPRARLDIIQAFGKTRNLDHFEVLLYAMTDPAPAVVHAANAALAKLRRNADAVPLPEKFTEAERRRAFDQWKAWYLSIRPDAKLEWEFKNRSE